MRLAKSIKPLCSVPGGDVDPLGIVNAGFGENGGIVPKATLAGTGNRITLGRPERPGAGVVKRCYARRSARSVYMRSFGRLGHTCQYQNSRSPQRTVVMTAWKETCHRRQGFGRLCQSRNKSDGDEPGQKYSVVLVAV
jgi:hypothetical protein